MSTFKVKSFAKINLALNVVEKKSSLHKIETIVSFINLHDKILIKEIKSKKHNIFFTGKFSKNIGKKNTVNKLCNKHCKKHCFYAQFLERGNCAKCTVFANYAFYIVFAWFCIVSKETCKLCKNCA